MEEIKYKHKEEKFFAALNITEERFNKLKEKIGLLGFLSQAKSEALEMIMKDEDITAEEKPAACFLLGALLEQRDKK